MSAARSPQLRGARARSDLRKLGALFSAFNAAQKLHRKCGFQALHLDLGACFVQALAPDGAQGFVLALNVLDEIPSLLEGQEAHQDWG